MKKSAFGLLALFLLLTVSVMAALDDDGFTGVNSFANNPSIQVHRSGNQLQPVYVEGDLLSNTTRGNEIADAIKFFNQHKADYKMSDPANELVQLRIDTDQLGFRHVRFQQYHLGVKVLGHEMTAHFNNEGILRTVSGHYQCCIETDNIPVLNSSTATNIAQADLLTHFGPGDPGDPELVYFPWQDKVYLAWRVFLYSSSPMGRWEYLIDAKTGELIFYANRIMNDNDIGTGTGVMGGARNHIDTDWNGSTYRMYDDTRQLSNDPHGHGGQMPAGRYIQTNIASSSLPGSIATDADNIWDNTSTQSPAVDGQVYSALVYDWMLSQFNRNSFDDAGASMLTSVNYSAEGNNNAYWNGSQIVIWSWGSGWRSLAGCPDVVAHEWGHAVTEHGSNLVYQLESGALNESFSDMMGAAFEFAHDSMDTPDWFMGENGMTTGNGFRSLSNPPAFGDPDTYGIGDPNWVDVNGCSPSSFNDWCGVHTNSGVGNKWFYLLSDGGLHNGTTVTGIGVANAMLVAYRANMFYWNSQTDYHEAALGTISAANDLDPSEVWASRVATAWTAVNVTIPGPSLVFSYPDGLPEVLVPDQDSVFRVQVDGSLGGSPLTSSGRLFTSVDGSAYVESSILHISGNQYDATLPGIACGRVLRYYVRFRESETGYFYDPDTANPNFATAAVNVVFSFEDNFETAQGWTVSGSVSDGQWGRGTPIGGGDRGDPPTDFDGSGQCYLTDNVDGNSDVDGGTTILTSPNFDLSDGDAQISYARWFSNNNGGSPNIDMFRVFLSNNGGASWTQVDSAGPVNQAGGGWYEVSFMASDFLVPTATMKLKYEAEDIGDGSVVEAGVDAVSVKRFECGATAPYVTTNSLPDWTEGGAYSQQLTSQGGTGIIIWSDKNSELVGTGLSLSATGLLLGTIGSAGTIQFTAMVTDDSMLTGEKLLTLTINPAILIDPSALPDWTEQIAYSQQLSSSGGTGVHTFADKNSELVGTGLALSATGLLTGTLNSTGTISFTALVIDQGGGSSEQLFAFEVNPAVSVITNSLPDGSEGDFYSSQLNSTGGTGDVSWTESGSALSVVGLSLSSSGLIEGTANDTGLVTFTINATDSVGSTDQKELTIYFEQAWICGDVDNSGDEINITDLTYFVDYLFKGGPPPPIQDAADVDGSGEIDITDITYIVEYLFKGGPSPVCP